MMNNGLEKVSARQRITGIFAVLTVLLSAFLLFVLELAVAKALLPRFGGSPMVWTTSMLAYQVLLFAGYGCAHRLASCRTGRLPALIYINLMAVAAMVAWFRLRMDVLGGGDAAAISRQPVQDLLLTMAGTLALPFVAVSATSPLVQHWQQRMDAGRSSYWLYAVSNIGSFAGLLAYPFLIEPFLSLDLQFFLWKMLFILAACCLSLLAWRTGGVAHDSDGEDCAERVVISRGWREILPWLALPAATSALLLAATNELCQDLAVFPFLWVLPLALYLLSFSLAFRAQLIKNRMAEAAVVTVVVLSTSAASVLLPAPVHVVAISALVFILCLAVHRELYRLRPAVQRLTAYYLWIATGSGVGAACVALGAPAFFTGYWEFQISILVLWVLLAAVVATDKTGALRTGDTRHTVTLLGILIYAGVALIPEQWLGAVLPGWMDNRLLMLRVCVALALTALLWFGLLRRRCLSRSVIWPRILTGLIILLVECSVVGRVKNDLNGKGYAARNFFGVVRVQELRHPASGIQIRQLVHGRINHGWQYMNPELLAQPTTYHSPSTGVGVLLRMQQERKLSIRIGVTGLGVGALAAYPRSTDSIVFYEIDPEVVRLAEGAEAVFSFLNSCAGAEEVVLGDARQSMQSELMHEGGRDYDVLALDAFSSDAIPMHLLTHEAFALYMRHIAADGVIAVNISNRFLDLEPVLADVAQSFGLQGVFIDSLGDPPVRARSLWVLLAANGDLFQGKELSSISRPLTDSRSRWTDNSCSPFRLMKWWTMNSRHLRFIGKHKQKEGVTAPELSPSQTPGSPES